MPYNNRELSMAQILALTGPMGGGGGANVTQAILIGGSAAAAMSSLNHQQQQQQQNVNHNEVFRSMKVGNNSKTPYSDATQVKAWTKNEIHIFIHTHKYMWLFLDILDKL